MENRVEKKKADRLGRKVKLKKRKIKDQ